MKKLMLSLMLMPIAGCSSTAMTAYDKEALQFDVYQEWQMCRKMYKQSDYAYWLTQGTTDKTLRGDFKMPYLTDMRRDLIANRCYPLMRSKASSLKLDR